MLELLQSGMRTQAVLLPTMTTMEYQVETTSMMATMVMLVARGVLAMVPCRGCGQGRSSFRRRTPSRANLSAERHITNDCDQSQPRQPGACFNCVSVQISGLNARLTCSPSEGGHSKSQCTAPRKIGTCFNCVCATEQGEEGHSKAACTKPRKASAPAVSA